MMMLTILALTLYAGIMTVSAVAAVLAHRTARPLAEKVTWWLACLFFLGLALMRAFNVEELLRQEGRNFARGLELYADRQDMQAPLFLVTILFVALIGWLIFKRLKKADHVQPRGVPLIALLNRRSSLALIARFALLGFLPLIALRLISFHNVDRLLYHGPIKLNWVLEIGLCGAVGLAACLYCWRSMQAGSRSR